MNYLLLSGLVWNIGILGYYGWCKGWFAQDEPDEYCFHYMVTVGGYIELGGYAAKNADEAAAWLTRKFPGGTIVRLSCGERLREEIDPDLVILTAKASPRWAKFARNRVA